jgi:transposase
MGWLVNPHITAEERHEYLDTPRIARNKSGIFIFTLMCDHSKLTAKRQALVSAGTFNPRSDEVRHPLFAGADFFDPHDLVQLKYEALRAIETDGYSVAQAAREYGLSRPTLYQARMDFLQSGMEGLLPGKRGPKAAHKLTDEVRRTLESLHSRQPALKAGELARSLAERHKVKVHPRTIEKALQTGRVKKGRRRQRGTTR